MGGPSLSRVYLGADRGQWAWYDENMHENGHDENQENEANQNVLNVIVQEDNDEMNNAMIVEDSVDKLIPRNSNSFDLLNKDCQMTMKPVWR